MSRPCPNCGAPAAPEARFCRLCGTPLKVAGTGGGVPVSPRAQTIPLSDEGRTTHGLGSEDGTRTAPDTHRVGRAEMDSILRRPLAPAQKTNGAHAGDGVEAEAAPITSELKAPADGASASTGSDGPGAVRATAETMAQAQTPATDSGVNQLSAKKDQASAKAQTGGARRWWQVAAAALLGIAVGATLLAFYYSRSRNREDTKGSPPISISDQKRLVEEKLAEAENLLAAGNTTDAISRLRYAVRLDPSNARAHSLLGEALERTGAVNEAIDEYRAATQLDARDERTWLRYADALRRTGRTDEAREVYQKLSASSSEETARAAREQLAQLPPAAQGSAEQQARDARAQGSRTADEEKASAQPSPVAQATTPSTTAGAQAKTPGSADADYQTAMKIIQGKDIKRMNRAELLHAYELFQRAQSGTNGAEAARRVQELDKELFERRKRKS